MDGIEIVARDGVHLHIGVHGRGPDVVVLSGGPGCEHYLAKDSLAPEGFRVWFPTPRGVAPSEGGPHAIADAVADLEDVRRAVGVQRWIVVGHSWGCDLAVRYALERPSSVTAVVGIAGRGPQRDRLWSEAYEAGKQSGGDPTPEMVWSESVWKSLSESFTEWTQSPDLWRSLADASVPMSFIAAGADVRPAWPLAQLAALVPDATFEVVPAVPHNFWATHPDLWREVVTAAAQAARPDSGC